MSSSVEFRLRMSGQFFDLPRPQRRRICRCIKELWLDIVGPNPRYARGFYVTLLNFGSLRWFAPTTKHFVRFRRMLLKVLAPGYVTSLVRL